MGTLPSGVTTTSFSATAAPNSIPFVFAIGTDGNVYWADSDEMGELELVRKPRCAELTNSVMEPKATRHTAGLVGGCRVGSRQPVGRGELLSPEDLSGSAALSLQGGDEALGEDPGGGRRGLERR